MSGIMFKASSPMSCTLSTMSTSHSVVKIPTTLTGAKEWYEANASTSEEVDLIDVKLLEMPDGRYQYTTCIYDCAAARRARARDLKLNCSFMPFVFIGDILLFKTIVSAETFNDMNDTIQDADLDAEEMISIVKTFRNRLTDTASSSGLDGLQKVLFPFIRRSSVGGKSVYTDCNYVFNSVEIDLLTWKTKVRGFQQVGVFNDIELLERSMRKDVDKKRICVACKGPTRFSCSACKMYYSCGEEKCRKKAWREHKAACKAACISGVKGSSGSSGIRKMYVY